MATKEIALGMLTQAADHIKSGEYFKAANELTSAQATVESLATRDQKSVTVLANFKGSSSDPSFEPGNR